MPYVYTPRQNSNTSSNSGGGLTQSFGSRGSGGGGLVGSTLSPRPPGTQGQAVPSSRDRGAPERIEANIMGAVQTAAMAPAHALERPLSIANTAAKFVTGTPQEEKGPIDHILAGIGSIGIGEANLGNLLGAVGEGIMHVGNAPMAIINQADAARLAAYGDSPDDTVMTGKFAKKIDGGFLGFLGIGGRDMTVGELKEELARRGWNQQVDMETGAASELTWDEVVAKAKTDSLGFGDKMINDSAIVDIAGRIGLDPFNILLGAGAIGKAGKFASWAVNPAVKLTGRLAGTRAGAWGAGYLADMSRLGVRAAQFPSATLSARAISAGRMESATLRGLGMVLAAPRALLLPGTGSLGRRYARGALRTEIGLLGVEFGSGAVDAAATSVLGEDNVVSGFMEPIHDAGQAMLADKPMSQDITFMMVSAFAMPAVPLLRDDARAVAGRARQSFGDQDLFLWSQKYGTDESGITALRDPMGRRRGKAKQASFLERLGGDRAFAELIDHIDMRLAFERLSAYMPTMRHFASFDEAMARSRAIGYTVAREAQRMREAGQIKARDRMEAFEAWGRSHSRTIVDRDGNILRDVPERVDFELSPDALIEQWIRYRDLHAQLSRRFKPVAEAIVGRANRLTQEDIQFVAGAIAGAAKDGRVSAAFVRDLLSQAPGMFEDVSLSQAQREFWRRIMNLGVGATSDGQYSGGRARTPKAREGTLDAAELAAELRALSEHAPTARDLYHEAARAEAKAPRATTTGSGAVVRNGRLRKIYSLKRLRDLRVESNAEIRSLTKEIDSRKLAMDRKWTSKGKLRIRRKRVVRQTSPEASPMGGIDELRSVARGYNERAGLPALREREYWAADPDFGRRTGLAYEALPAVDNSLATTMAYERFVAETLDQWRALEEAGYRMEPWTDELAAKAGKEQPYATSEEMQADVRGNKHLYFFTGGEPHPFMGTALDDFGGLTANDIFRAVHDIMTHAQEGFQFGARGELNAAIKHAQMYTPIARRAMLTETHGQNSWTNHGPHNPQRLPAPERPYAAQKAALLPDEIIHEFESRFIGETQAVASRKAREAAEALGLTGEQANAAAAILEARARAWASNNPGKTAADYLRRFRFEKGGDPAEGALGQGPMRARTALSAFPRERGLRPGSEAFRRRERLKQADERRRDGYLPRPGTPAAERMYESFLPDTEEIAFVRNAARAEVLSPEGPGPYSEELRQMGEAAYRAEYDARREARRSAQTDTLYQSDDVQMIPVSALERFMEIDREVTPKVRGDFGHLDELTEQIRQNGITEPLSLDYSAETGTALLGDGNHRLAAAKRLGITEVPVRIGDVVDNSVLGPEVARALPADEIRPSDIVGTPEPVLFQSADELLSLVDEPVPAVLEENGLGGASPLEILETEAGPIAIPGGVEGLADGTFSLWDMWKLRAQAFDPSNLPPDVANALYAKIFRTHVRSLKEDSLDALNRMAFAMLSPNTALAKNETLYSVIRMRTTDDVAELASIVDDVQARGVEEGSTLASEVGFEIQRRYGLTGEGSLKGPKTVSTNTQLGNLALTAQRYLQDPEFFLLRDGESLIEYVERLSAVTPGAAFKVANFGVMLGDPIAAPVGTMDSWMAQLVGAGNKAPASKKIAYRNRAGEINPAVPAHLRDLPWEPKEVTVYGGDYAKAHQVLESLAAGDKPDTFAMGGYQWLRWDKARGQIEPHPLVYPGAYRLPKMDPSARQAAYDELGRAGFTGDAPTSPFPPSRAFIYQTKGERFKGSTEFLEDGTAVIRGLASPDISTFIHEVGHVFRRDLVGGDLAVAETHYKVVDGVWTREAEEAFARDFERWTRTGKNAPAGLERIFAQLYEWMRQVYRSVLRRDVDARMGQVFTRLFKEAPGPDLRSFSPEFGRIRGNMNDAARATGEANTVGVVRDLTVGETRMATLAKYGDDGKAVAYLNIVFDPSTGVAAKDGLYIETVREGRGQGHATDLYAYAEARGWEVEQASAMSENLTEAGRAFQKARWAKQRQIEATQLDLKRERVRDLRREARDIAKRADEIRTTRIDPSFLDENGNPKVDAETVAALREQTAFVHDTFPTQYGIEAAPRVSYARYQPDDSHLAALLTERSNLAQVLFDYGPIAKATQFLGWITQPVKASRMAHDGRQQVYNLLLPLKAKSDEVTNFLNALRDEQSKGYSVGKLNQPFFRGVTALPPNRIRTIAAETLGANKAFVQAFEAKYGGLDRIHVMLDEAHNSLIRRVDLRIMRGQKVGRLERILRTGYWAWSHIPGLRAASDATRMVSKVYYPLFRFQMDARWQALNIIEADTLAFFRDGIDGTRFSRQKDKVVRRGGKDINLSQNALDFHGEQSGMPQVGKKGAGTEAAYEETGIFLTNQNLAPVLRRQFDMNRLESVDSVINELAATDPLFQLLERKYGPEKGTWAEQLNETLYSFDRYGVKKSIDEAVRRVRKYDAWSQAEYDQMLPFINKLIERNQRTFEDLVQIQVGNINRSRLERTLNSFWLYWPLSYQIKATKWMVGVLSQRAFGQNTNLGGAFSLERAASIVREQSRNPAFAQEMEDNEDWWFVASMLLPIAPWDWGMSLNRHVRYVGGNVLGLWPEYAGLDDAGDYARKTLEMGPIYTMDLIDRFTTEKAEKDKRPSFTSFAP